MKTLKLIAEILIMVCGLIALGYAIGWLFLILLFVAEVFK